MTPAVAYLFSVRLSIAYLLAVRNRNLSLIERFRMHTVNNLQDLEQTETGNFSAVPNEILEYLCQADLTSREHRIVIFLVREIIGYHLLQKIVKTEKISFHTKIQRNHINPTIKSLIKKGLIEREEISIHGEYIYRFKLETFGRIHATETVNKHYYYNGKVIHNSESACPTQARERAQLRHGSVTNLGTLSEPEKPSESATRVALENIQKISKDIKRKDKDILREKIPDGFSKKGTGTETKQWIKGQSHEETERKRQANLELLSKMAAEDKLRLETQTGELRC